MPDVNATSLGWRIAHRTVSTAQREAGKRKQPATSKCSTMSTGPIARERRGRRLDVVGAASYLGLTERHLRQLVFERRLTHFKLGRRLVFDTDDLDAYLEANRREASQGSERIQR